MPVAEPPDPPGATSPSPLPKEEKNDRRLRLSTAPTHSSPSPAAGCSQIGTPLLPAAATTTMPAAVVAEHADRHDHRARRHALDPDPVAASRRDDPAHVGAVAVAVLRRRVALDHVVALADAPGE